MSSGTFYLLVCLATVAAAKHEALKESLWVPGIEELCHSFDHQSACRNLNYNKFQLRCSNAYCLGQSKPGKTRPVYDVGPAHDGVQCGKNRVCFRGVCTELPGGITMPKQSPMQPSAHCSKDRIQVR